MGEAAIDGEWISYRDAYRTMVLFEKYGKAKHLIQQHLQVLPRDRAVSTEGLQLTLYGKTMRQNLPLDATGRAQFPSRKTAYDENASLVLNRKAGNYQFRARISIVLRPDGMYDVADLHAACEQALAYQRYSQPALPARQCRAVRFVFPKELTEPGVRVHKGDAQALTVANGAAFDDDASDHFRVVTYKFGAAQAREQVLSPYVPLAITPVFE